MVTSPVTVQPDKLSLVSKVKLLTAPRSDREPEVETCAHAATPPKTSNANAIPSPTFIAGLRLALRWMLLGLLPLFE
jgi:hypothetical protein